MMLDKKKNLQILVNKILGRALHKALLAPSSSLKHQYLKFALGHILMLFEKNSLLPKVSRTIMKQLVLQYV